MLGEEKNRGPIVQNPITANTGLTLKVCLQ